MRVGVIGLGSMGYGMAASLIRAGHAVHGADLRAEAMERLRAEGGAAEGLAEVTLDALVLVVLNAAQSRAALIEALPGVEEGGVVIGCATVPPDAARAMAETCEGAGVHYLDAPISGGAAKAASGELSIMASGSAEAFAAARPALDAMATTVFEIGAEPGQGSAMKAVNQLLAGVHIAAMAEAMTFGISQGIDPARFMEVIPHCAGSSWMLENRGPHVRDADYEARSQVDIWPKDLGIVSDIARGSKVPVPLTAAALQQFIAASAAGLGQEDDAAVAKIYARSAGVDLP